MGECPLCMLVAEVEGGGELIHLTSHWTVNARRGDQRPAIVAQVVPHVTRWAELPEPAQVELGAVIARVEAALSGEPSVARVYVESYNETGDGHVHVHLVPRFIGESPIGPDLRRRAGAPEDFDVSRVLGRLRPPAVADPVAPMTRRLHDLAFLSVNGKWHPYTTLKQSMAAGRLRALRQHFDPGEAYVTGWLLLEAVLLAAGAAALHRTHAGRISFAVVSGLLVWRAFDIFLYQASILLKDSRSPLLSYSRSLLLAGFNLIELGMITASVMLASDSVGEALTQGARMTAFQGDFGGQGPWVSVFRMAMLCIALTVAVGGIGLPLGKLGETFHSTKDST